jgi:predicted HTH transcriptional regulator
MPKVKDNYVVRGISGSVGKMLVFKHRKDGTTIVAAHPDRSQVRSTKKQTKKRNKFVEAVKFGKYVITNPAAAVMIKVKKHQTLYNAAIAVFMKDNKELVDEILRLKDQPVNEKNDPVLSPRQHKVMKWVRKNKAISSADYRRITRVSKPTATRDLHDLVKKKILKSSGVPGAGAHYILLG